jgi:integrase
VRAALAPVKAMDADAFEDGHVRTNPTRVRVRGRSGGDDRPRALTRAELAAFLAELPDDWRLCFRFLAATGLRISELVGLRWQDVCWHPEGGAHLAVRWQDHKGELVELKSERSRRTVPLAPGMAAELWALGADRPGDERVFTAPHGGPLQRHNLHNRVLAPARERAGLGWASFHTFRHTSASLAFDAGRNVAQVAALLGHTDPSLTLRTYVHLLDEGPGAGLEVPAAAPEPEAAAVAA